MIDVHMLGFKTKIPHGSTNIHLIKAMHFLLLYILRDLYLYFRKPSLKVYDGALKDTLKGSRGTPELRITDGGSSAQILKGT